MNLALVGLEEEKNRVLLVHKRVASSSDFDLFSFLCDLFNGHFEKLGVET